MCPSNPTLDFYDENAVDYAADPSGPGQQRRLESFAARFAPGEKIPDLGSGGGHDALLLIDLGLDVTLVDGSAGLAKEAERRTGRAVNVLSFEELDYVEAFHGIWASASLHHAQSAVLADVMKRVVLALKPSGLIFASFKEAETDWHDRLGRYFAAMSSDRLRRLVEQAGLIVETIERSMGSGYDGADVMWLSMIARKKR